MSKNATDHFIANVTFCYIIATHHICLMIINFILQQLKIYTNLQQKRYIYCKNYYNFSIGKDPSLRSIPYIKHKYHSFFNHFQGGEWNNEKTVQFECADSIVSAIRRF